MSEDKNTCATLTGKYLHTLMRDYQSGYTVFKILATDGIITCTGNIILPSLNMKVNVMGFWKETKYGNQLVDCTLETVYSDKDGMIEYLCNIPGVGMGSATRLAQTYGERLYSIAMGPNASAVLSKVPGIPSKRVNDIIAYIQGTEEQRKLFNFIKSHGGSYIASTKIYKEHGHMSLAKLFEDPYFIGYKAGLDFRVCDSIAKELNCLSYGTVRMGAAIRHLLKNKTSAGDTYATLSELIKGAREFLGYTQEFESVSSAILNGHISDGLEACTVESDGTTSNVFLSSVYYNEVRAAFALRRLVKGGIPTECNPDELCSYAESACGVTYAEQQREAYRLLQIGGVGIITGGPGTGKTTVIKGLLAAYDKLHPNAVIKLCAPTGRASQRMKEATGREATTIHRLLEYKPFGEIVTCKNEADPIDADLIFIDEGSMIPIDIADMLFSAIRSGTLVLIAGDIDQLPSVGAGNVLHDIISSGVVPVVSLTKTHRQAEGSLIIQNAHRIRDGLPNLVSGDDFEIHICKDEDMPALIEKQYIKYHDPADVFSVQILTPSRKRATGTKDLNKRIQAAVNPSARGLTYADITFRLGDKIMLMRNNYAAEDAYYNGDIGLVSSISDSGLILLVDGESIHVDESQLDDVTLAYGSTIHKSQGSEYDTVICVLPSEPANMLQRNLLYTAVTRAKKKLVLIAAPGAIEKAVFTVDATKRKSMLAARLKGRHFTKEN